MARPVRQIGERGARVPNVDCTASHYISPSPLTFESVEALQEPGIELLHGAPFQEAQRGPHGKNARPVDGESVTYDEPVNIPSITGLLYGLSILPQDTCQNDPPNRLPRPRLINAAISLGLCVAASFLFSSSLSPFSSPAQSARFRIPFSICRLSVSRRFGADVYSLFGNHEVSSTSSILRISNITPPNPPTR